MSAKLLPPPDYDLIGSAPHSPSLSDTWEQIVDWHAHTRDRKHLKTHKMVVSNRSIFTIKDVINRKAREEEQ